METLRQMVVAGVGITLIPRLACSPNPAITYIPFGSPKPLRSIGLYWRGCSAKQPLLQDLAKHIKELMKKQKSLKV